MSLKDILGFDPAVQCHPLSLALCLVLVFFSTSYPASLHSHVAILLHFVILSSLTSFSLFHFRFLILFLLLLLLTHRFCVCFPDGGRKRSRKFICRDVAPYSKTRMIYLHGAEGETGRDGFTRERFIERYAEGKKEKRNAKCIF